MGDIAGVFNRLTPPCGPPPLEHLSAFRAFIALPDMWAARFGAVLCGAIASVTVGPVPLFAATATGSFQVGATVAANCAITAEDDVNNAVRVISLRCINPPS